MTIAIVAALCVVLVLLLKLYMKLMATFVWGCVLLVGLWVLGNVLLLIYLEDADNTVLRAVYHGWSAFFFYSSLLQAVVFMTLIFWGMSLIFNPGVSPPDSMQKFVIDFVKGSSALAAMVFLGAGGTALTDEPSAGLAVLAVAYLLAVVAAAVMPWIFGTKLSAWTEAYPAPVFWSTIAVYSLFSAVGMALYDASMTIPQQ